MVADCYVTDEVGVAYSRVDCAGAVAFGGYYALAVASGYL